MSEILVEEYRGGILENVHKGRICITGDEGEILYKVGDPYELTFYRSSSKPLQALPIIARGLDKKYGLTGPEVTVLAASHSGERMHIEILESLLAKTDFKEDDLIMNPTFPFCEEHRNYLIKNAMPPRKLYHNCAGKHIALMMLSRELGEDHRTYWKPDSSAQKEVLYYISYLSGYAFEKVGIGIDGCGVPVFAVPLQGIANSYMKLACPDKVSDNNIRAAIIRLTGLISENPYIMRGHGLLCSEFNLDKNVIAKGGAMGVYGFGLKKERLGVALKIEDGSESSWPLIIAEIVKQLGYSNQQTFDILYRLAPTHIINDNKTIVGEYRTVFKLKA